jgi:hypothetical protein
MPAESDDYGADVQLDMKQVAAYANAMARHRGYPDDTAAMIARRIVFLERRNLAGLANLYREVMHFRKEPLTSRFKHYRPDGSEGGQCPFYAGIELESSFDRLTSAPRENRLWTPAPSNALLLVPKLAEWLRPTGRRAIFWWKKEEEVPGFIVVEGFRLASYSKIEPGEAFDKLQCSDYIGFSDCPDDFEPVPQPRSGFCEKITVQLRQIAMMEDYLRS